VNAFALTVDHSRFAITYPISLVRARRGHGSSPNTASTEPPPQIPPSGIAACAPERVEDPDMHQIEWWMICQ
jgi:hypothetical protein